MSAINSASACREQLLHAALRAVESDAAFEKISTPTQPTASNVQETPVWRAIAVAAEQLTTETNWFVTRFTTRRKGKSQLNCYEFMKRAFYF